MYAGDSDGGSHVEFSAPWGLRRGSRKVPSLDHWRDDLVPFYYCCGWQQPPAKSPNFAHDCFNLYATARPTVDCKFYRPPGLGEYIQNLVVLHNHERNWYLWVQSVLVSTAQPRRNRFKVTLSTFSLITWHCAMAKRYRETFKCVEDILFVF